MKRIVLVGLAGLLAGCFDFDGALSRCRDDAGVWRCGDAGGENTGGGGEATGGGSTTGGGTMNTGGGIATGGGGGVDAGAEAPLVCNKDGWCWEFPRPVGTKLNVVWVAGENDYWVAGIGGVLAHFDGSRWSSYPQNHDVTALCAFDGALYAAIPNGTTSTIRRFDGSAWLDFKTNLQSIVSMTCAHDGVYALSSNRVTTRYASDAGVKNVFTTPLGCTGPLAVYADGGVLTGCGRGSVITLVSSTGGTELSYDAGLNARLLTLWADPAQGIFAGVGADLGTVLRRDLDGGWSVAWQSTVGGNDIYGGSSGPGRSVAVGQGGVVVDLVDGTGVRSADLKMEYAFAAAFFPSGETVAVGGMGCLQRRAHDTGDWDSNACRWESDYYQLDLEPRHLLLTYGALYERFPEGWSKVSLDVPIDSIGFHQLRSDGGIVLLRSNDLQFSNGVTRPLPVQSVEEWSVLTDDVAYLRTGTAVAGINPSSGMGDGLTPFTPGVDLTSMALDPATGLVFVGGADGRIFVRGSNGAWGPEDAGLHARVVKVRTGFGRVWAMDNRFVAYRTGTGQWTSRDAGSEYLDSLVPRADGADVYEGINDEESAGDSKVFHFGLFGLPAVVPLNPPAAVLRSVPADGGFYGVSPRGLMWHEW